MRDLNFIVDIGIIVVLWNVLFCWTWMLFFLASKKSFLCLFC